MCVRGVGSVTECNILSDDTRADYFWIKQLLGQNYIFLCEKKNVAADVVCLIIIDYRFLYIATSLHRKLKWHNKFPLIQISIQMISSILYDTNCPALHNTPHIAGMLRHYVMLPYYAESRKTEYDSLYVFLF